MNNEMLFGRKEYLFSRDFPQILIVVNVGSSSQIVK